MNLRNILLTIGLFAIGVLLKKMGWSLGVVLLYASIGFYLFYSLKHIYKVKKTKELIAVLLLFTLMTVSVFILQYKIRPDSAEVLIIVLSTFVLQVFLRLSKIKILRLLLVFPLTIIIIAGTNDYRSFHNIFHSTPFESYIRSKYSYTERSIADSIIQKYAESDSIKARSFFDQALEKFTAGKAENAIAMLDKAIDAYPFSSKYYDTRGYYKFSSRSLEVPDLYEALKDFERACELDSNNTLALFHHAQCLNCMKLKQRACDDIKKLKQIDSLFDLQDFEEKTCK